jgi:hypothetical protein
MISNSRGDKNLAWIVLTILIGFLIYLTFVFTPGWLWHFEHSQGKATIQSVDTEKRFFVYSYFNVYKSDTVESKRKVDKVGDLGGISVNEVLPITYSKFQSGYVRFESIDSKPMLFLTASVYVLVIIGILLYIAVLRNKISLETLVGTAKPEEMDGEE